MSQKKGLLKLALILTVLGYELFILVYFISESINSADSGRIVGATSVLSLLTYTTATIGIVLYTVEEDFMYALPEYVHVIMIVMFFLTGFLMIPGIIGILRGSLVNPFHACQYMASLVMAFIAGSLFGYTTFLQMEALHSKHKITRVHPTRIPKAVSSFPLHSPGKFSQTSRECQTISRRNNSTQTHFDQNQSIFDAD